VTLNETTALGRARVAIQSAEAALSNAKWNRDVQALRTRVERLDLRLAHARAGRLLTALDRSARGGKQ
jgi:hypothetical protein